MSVAIAFILTAAFLILITGIYCLIISKDIFKTIISIILLFKAAILVIALGGWISSRLDLAQVMIISIIIIELVLVVIAVLFTLKILEQNGKIDSRKLNKMLRFLKR